ncbi:hypothetical protein KC865_00420 [Candidatus Kaiserbacteria bacterium]|nr:hypothetical protein [Candidatus Kaiserbacteria bacterium]USN91792.1 MAG: hypothetical protein H6782_02870 [Candidatus Nomurabacteria bacterium]
MTTKIKFYFLAVVVGLIVSTAVNADANTGKYSCTKVWGNPVTLESDEKGVVAGTTTGVTAEGKISMNQLNSLLVHGYVQSYCSTEYGFMTEEQKNNFLNERLAKLGYKVEGDLVGIGWVRNHLMIPGFQLNLPTKKVEEVVTPAEVDVKKNVTELKQLQRQVVAGEVPADLKDQLKKLRSENARLAKVAKNTKGDLAEHVTKTNDALNKLEILAKGNLTPELKAVFERMVEDQVAGIESGLTDLRSEVADGFTSLKSVQEEQGGRIEGVQTSLEILQQHASVASEEREELRGFDQAFLKRLDKLGLKVGDLEEKVDEKVQKVEKRVDELERAKNVTNSRLAENESQTSYLQISIGFLGLGVLSFIAYFFVKLRRQDKRMVGLVGKKNTTPDIRIIAPSNNPTRIREEEIVEGEIVSERKLRIV